MGAKFEAIKHATSTGIMWHCENNLEQGSRIQDNFKEFKRKCPYSSYRFGFVVFDTENNCVPKVCNDWNESPEEAMFDFEENCQ